MAFFIITVVLIIGGIIVWVIVDPSSSSPMFVIAGLFLMLGLFANWGGYDEATISNEYALIPIIDGTDVYVIQSDDDTKMCKYEVVSEHDKNIKNETIKKVRASVEIEYISEKAKPVLREYISKPKKSKWNGIYADTKKYSVLFVPEAYIIK